MKRYTEQGLLERKWIDTYCLGGEWKNCVRYHMDEQGEYHPDNMLPDGSVNKGLKP